VIRTMNYRRTEGAGIFEVTHALIVRKKSELNSERKRIIQTGEFVQISEVRLVEGKQRGRLRNGSGWVTLRTDSESYVERRILNDEFKCGKYIAKRPLISRKEIALNTWLTREIRRGEEFEIMYAILLDEKVRARLADEGIWITVQDVRSADIYVHRIEPKANVDIAQGGFVLKKSTSTKHTMEVKSDFSHVHRVAKECRVYENPEKRPVLTPVFDHRELLKLLPKEPSWRPRKEEFHGYRATLEAMRKFRGEKPIVEEPKNVFLKLKMIEKRYQTAVRCVRT